MLQEMARVSKRMVIVRCPHRRGSGAKRPFHVNYLDEHFFLDAANKLGLNCDVFTNSYDYPVSNRLRWLPTILQRNVGWRGLRHLERRLINADLYHRPFELEARLTPKPAPHYCNTAWPIQYIVAVNDGATYLDCFRRSAGVNKDNVTAYTHVTNLAQTYNHHIESNLDWQGWFVFCHQDLIFKQPLQLTGLRTDAVYGVIGARLTPHFIGQITQTNGKAIGKKICKPEPVHTLDEVCLIVHSHILRLGLRFDPKLALHFYGADLCLSALKHGFGVYALQTSCQHRSKTLTGSVNCESYLQTHKMFREKWITDFPVRTTTATFEN